MAKKYIKYDRPEVYAIIYKLAGIIYYNIGFTGHMKLFVLCP